jgi:hypothetical protein
VCYASACRLAGEAIAVVHRPMFVFCSIPVKPTDVVAQMSRAQLCKLATKAPSGAQSPLGQKYQGWRGRAPRAP